MKQGKKCYGFVVDGERVNGKRRQITRQGFPSIAAAEKARTALLHRKHTGDVVEPSRELLSDFFERWLSGKALSVRETTLIDYRRTFTRLLPALGDRPIGAIRGDHIQGMVTALVAKGYAARTVREAVNLLRLVFRSAVEWRLVHRSPATYIELPRIVEERKPILSAQQLHSLVTNSADDPEWGVALHVLVESWMRKGELLDLRWGAVDFGSGVVRVERGLSRTVDGLASLPGKTPSARRSITCSPALMDRLRQYKDTERFWWRARGLELSDDTLVFPDHRTGSWREPTSVNYAVRQACKRAGVPVVSPHWLRHSGISVARLADKDIVTIAKRAGHKDISTTYGVYSHTQEAEEVALGTAFGALVGFG